MKVLINGYVQGSSSDSQYPTTATADRRCSAVAAAAVVAAWLVSGKAEPVADEAFAPAPAAVDA